MPAHGSPSRRRAALTASAIGLAAVLAACGSGGSSDHSGMSGTAASSSGAAGSAASGSAGSSSHMGNLATYPPVTPGPAASGPHNEADVAFAEGMIPHHGQAVQMADTILAKTTNAQVKALADRIKQAQTPEIATLSGWLKGWGRTAPDPYEHMAGMSGMEHGGMMSDEEMARLDQATGPAADRLFLTQMQQHHAGAVAMAKTEVEQGSNPEAKKLATSISTSQTAEIAEMKALLGTLA